MRGNFHAFDGAEDIEAEFALEAPDDRQAFYTFLKQNLKESAAWFP
ncbi:MAG: hypothetical protein ACI8T1_001625 [Verrucomicrobiales bacterium]|jgi:hypothetical protein